MVNLKEFFIGIYGLMSCGFLTLFIWWAVIFGGESGKLVLYFNIFNEMWIEFFLLNGLLIVMIIIFIKILQKNEKKLQKFKIED